MPAKITLDTVVAPSEDVVAREVQGEFIIIPIAAGVGDMEDDIYTFNGTGRAIWLKIDGRKTLRGIVDELSSEFKAPAQEMRKDVLGFLAELLKRRMIVAAKRGQARLPKN